MPPVAPTTPTGNRSREEVIAKIKKCLEMASNDTSNEQEIATALRQAQAYMRQYGLSEHDIHTSEVLEHDTLATAKQTPPIWEQKLVQVIAAAFGAKVLFSPGYIANKGQWRFIGIGAQAEVCSYTYEVLLRQLTHARQSHIKTKWPHVSTAKKKQMGELFCIGWVDAVWDKVKAFAEPYPCQPAVEAYCQAKYPVQGKVKRPKVQENLDAHGQYALVMGRQAGKEVTLNMGVSGRNNKPDLVEHKEGNHD